MIAFIDEHRPALAVEPICKVLPTCPVSSACFKILNLPWISRSFWVIADILPAQ